MRSIVLAVLLFAVPASARTLVFPHFVERSGFISNTQYTFDTNFFFAYTAGLGGTGVGGGAHYDVYLYDLAGSPTTNNGNVVCNPCSYDLGATKKASLRVESAMLAFGAMDTPVKTGYAIVTVSGDEANASAMGSLFHAHTSPFDLANVNLTPWVIEPHGNRVIVLPHFFELAGNAATTPNTFDNTFFAAYVGGQAGLAGGAGATLDLYLYADDGTALKNNGTNVCGPCTYNVGGGANRKASIKLEDAILAQGAFDATSKSGFAIMVVRGNDPDGLALWGLLTNSHTNGFDLTMTELPLETIDASLTLAAPSDRGFVRTLEAQPNPSRGGVAFTFELARPGNVTFAVYDALGRKVRTLTSGSLAAGPQRTNWDGKDDGGASVAPGVYFGKLIAGSDVQASKLVVLP